MDTKGKFPLSLPHGAAIHLWLAFPYKRETGTLQVVEGIWDSECTARKYVRGEKEEILN